MTNGKESKDKTYLKSRHRPTTFPPACELVQVGAEAACRPLLNAKAFLALTRLGRGGFGDPRDKRGRVHRSRNRGFLWLLGRGSSEDLGDRRRSVHRSRNRVALWLLGQGRSKNPRNKRRNVPKNRNRGLLWFWGQYSFKKPRDKRRNIPENRNRGNLWLLGQGSSEDPRSKRRRVHRSRNRVTLWLLGQGRSKNPRNKRRSIPENRNRGLLWLGSSSAFNGSVEWTATKWIEWWTGIATRRPAATLLVAVHRDVVCTVARVGEALNAQHLLTLAAWNDGSVRQYFARW